MPARRKPILQGDAEHVLIMDWLESGRISFTDLKSLRISRLEVVVERNEKHYQLLSIPQNLGENDDLLLILDYFTTNYHWFENPSRTTRVKARTTATSFLDFLSQNYTSIESVSDAVIAFSNHLKIKSSPGGLIQAVVNLKKIFTRAINAQYPEVSKRPTKYNGLLHALNKIQAKKEDTKKKPALGQFLEISHKEYTNKQLLLGLRLGSMWLLNKIASFREKLVSAPAIARILKEVKGNTEDILNQLLPNNPYKLFKPDFFASDACYEQWCIIQKDPLLTEWQFYTNKKLRIFGLDYGHQYPPAPFPASTQELYINRCLDHTNKIVRKTLKGLGQKDQEWRAFRPVYHSARHTSRGRTILWGVDWITHSPLEKLLFVWLLSTERVQSTGISHMHINCINLDRLDKPKSLQLISMKLRRGGKRTLKRAEVKGQIYKRNHPPFKTYLAWRETCQHAIDTIENFNPTKLLVVHSSAALAGHMTSDAKFEVYVLLRALITEGTSWNATFLSENSDHPQEAKAFLHILRNRIIPNNGRYPLRLPPDPISQSLVLEKELETNYTTRDISINSSISGHTVETGRAIYKDGFLSAEVAEIVDPLNSFIRRVGDERFKDALTLSKQLEQATEKLTMAELKKISGIDDAQITIERLIRNLPTDDRLLLTGELLHDGKKFIVETDFTAAIMSSYIDHIQESMPDILNSERTETALALIGELIYLTQTLQNFSEEVLIAGEKLKNRLDFKFPPVI